MTRWCLGFVFNAEHDQVLLLRKGKTLHVGMWNGLGGKIEENERPQEAMERECEEEAKIRVDAPFWDFLGVITFLGNPNRVEVFSTWIKTLDLLYEPIPFEGPPAPEDQPCIAKLEHLDILNLAPHTKVWVYEAIRKFKNADLPPLFILDGKL